MNESSRLGKSYPNATSQDRTAPAYASASSANLSDQQLNSASSYANLDYLFGKQEIKMNAPKTGRNRRRPSDPSHVKHRRTRSGCYTCRSRRVKCDEGRPNCERCKKGSRECVYPEQTTNPKSSHVKNSQSMIDGSPDSSSGEEDGPGFYEPLDSIPDDVEDVDDHTSNERAINPANARRDSSQLSVGSKSSIRPGSETPSLVHDKGTSPTPSTEGSVGYPSQHGLHSTRYQQKFPSTSGPADIKHKWAHLPPDLQYYLSYFCEDITYMHYSFKFDPHDFLHTQLLEAALHNEALLYGVVGFAAFQRTLHQADGRIEDFLPYYNKAVSLLLLSLRRGERHDEGLLMAILQLATIEEFLGDWVNLLGHQKAAFEMITEIYNPQTVMEKSLTRTIMDWYMRFDVSAGLLGGFQTVLSREWFTSGLQFCIQQTLNQPDNLAWKLFSQLWQYRLIAMDMSLLFARMGKGEISPKQFEIENVALGKRIEEWKTKMDPALKDPQYLVHEFNGVPPPSCKSVVNPWEPGYFYSGPLFPMNVAMLDWLYVDIMHKYLTASITNAQPSPELVKKAYLSCQLFEAIELWPESPKGTILCIQAGLGISLLFLPRDDVHSMWGRRKFASVEANGYIYPYTFRSKFADLFRDRSCMHWWLPNDKNYPAIVKSIRKFVEERTAPPRDTTTEDLRDMKSIFSALKLDDDDDTQGGESEWQTSGMAGNLSQAEGF